LGFDPGVELGFLLGVEAQADDLADAGLRTSAASFFVSWY
jgi:hypothetical protein